MKTKTPLHRFTIFFIVLFTNLILFYSCQEDTDIEVFQEQEYQEKIEIYEQKIKDLEEQLAQEKTNRRRPGNIISFDQAFKIYKEYDQRADLISETVIQPRVNRSFEPTRSLFYDLSELRNYLNYIDDLSAKAGVKPTGLRLYFALYPSSYISPDGSSNNARRQTIFIAPTLAKEYDNKIVQIGYTLDDNFKIQLLDKNNGFSYLRQDRDKKSTFDIMQKIGGSGQYSLLANELGATPPEWGG